jgi:hypothetical protein
MGHLESYTENGYDTNRKSRKQGWDIQKVTKHGSVWNFEKLTRKKEMTRPGSYIENGDEK